LTPHVYDELSLYVLGLVDDVERGAIEAHLEECSACRAALAGEEEVAWAWLAHAIAREPSPGLRRAIVERHRAPWPRFLGALRPASLAAAVVLILLVGSTVLLATRDQLHQERAIGAEYARALGEVAAGATIVALEPSPGVSGTGALVIPRAGTPFLILALPRPPAGRVYEAWVIRDGVPIPAGLAPARDGVVTVPLREGVRSGDVTAVTIETEGGTGRPTGDAILAARRS
jgi:anti-sigma-K factor RskA